MVFHLATYGKIINCPVKKAYSSRDLEKSLYQLRTRQLVLIDTAGMSQKNMQLANQLENLHANPDLPIRSFLVLPATSQRQVLEDVISSFDVSKIAGVILTKTDESLSLGSALSVIIEHNIPISYVASGQRVPEDIALADPNKMAQQALGLLLQTESPASTSVSNHWSSNLEFSVD